MRSGTDKNIYFKSIRVGCGYLLSPTYSNSEDKVRYLTYKKLNYYKMFTICADITQRLISLGNKLVKL